MNVNITVNQPDEAVKKEHSDDADPRDPLELDPLLNTSIAKKPEPIKIEPETGGETQNQGCRPELGFDKKKKIAYKAW